MIIEPVSATKHTVNVAIAINLFAGPSESSSVVAISLFIGVA